MKVLLVNKYFFRKGGAEVSFFETAKLLTSKGHKVMHFSMKHPRNLPSPYEDYFVSNVDYETKEFSHALKASLRILYSFEARSKLEKLLCEEKPDIAHLNNIYHQISPSIVHSLKKFNIPIVMSLRDFKMVCGSYSLINNGRICEVCEGGKYYQCFWNHCVKDSRIKSLLNTLEMYLHHKILHIYDQIDIFISPSQFLRSKSKQMGFKGKIAHLPNFLMLNHIKPQFNWQEKSIIYFGRLIKEKGLYTLIKAVKDLNIGLKIIGEGPIKTELEEKVRSLGVKNITFLGYMESQELKKEILKCMFVILPSELYENNPRTIIEGFALGKPAIGTEMGGIPELIINNKTGFTYEPGNSRDLSAKIEYMINHENQIREFGKNAREYVETELNENRHYEKLMQIYHEAITRHSKQSSR